MTTTEIQLPKVAQTRISRLAHASGRSPAAMLRFVLRDGFDAVELSIKENAQADAEFAAGATVAHADVMRNALNAVQHTKHEPSNPSAALV
jgi:predicted transcriptional regulator